MLTLCLLAAVVGCFGVAVGHLIAVAIDEVLS